MIAGDRRGHFYGKFGEYLLLSRKMHDDLCKMFWHPCGNPWRCHRVVGRVPIVIAGGLSGGVRMGPGTPDQGPAVAEARLAEFGTSRLN